MSWAASIRAWWRNLNPEPFSRKDRCTCWYDSDGGPYGLPHWVDNPACPQHGRLAS